MSKPDLLQRFLTSLGFIPGPKQIAKQLRHPKGKLGELVAGKMNESNAFLYDFTLRTMQIQDDNAILELGFGNGKFFEKVFAQAKNLKVAGVDYSELMVNDARKFNAESIRQKSLDILYSNCQALPFDSNIFDKVFCINVIYFWENPREILDEIFRVLKPGGSFYASVRLKESLGQLAYTRYGFNFYEEESWKVHLANSHFEYLEGLEVDEPEFLLNGHELHFQSVCMVAQKPR